MEERLTGAFGLIREMGYSRQEFLRVLPIALSGCEFFIAGDDVSIKFHQGEVLIRIGVERERRFTDLLSFPILPVTIEFVGVQPTEQALFMQRFDLSYLKGLG
jgi:hypothetical protein